MAEGGGEGVSSPSETPGSVPGGERQAVEEQIPRGEDLKEEHAPHGKAGKKVNLQ